MTPRDYQLNYREAIRKGWADGFRKQLVVSPTGSGKTVMFSWEAEDAMNQGQRSLILVDQDELVWQTMKKLRQASSIIGEVEKAEYKASKDCPVVVATVQSMAGRLANWSKDHFGLVIADEADKSIAPQWQSVLTHFGSARVCGFTATPHRTDKKNLGCYYENLIELENLKTLIVKGFLSPVTVKMMPIQLDLSSVRLTKSEHGTDYDKHELDEIITPHLRTIAQAILDVATFRKTVVFLPLVKTCEKFAAVAREIGLNAEYIHGKDEDREDKLKRFYNYEFDCLANSQLLTRGYDDPSIDCIVPCRPTKSINLYFQIVGRGTRLTADIERCLTVEDRLRAIASSSKQDMLLLDFLYQASKRLICRPAHLIARSDEEVEAINEIIAKKSGMPGDVADQLDLIAIANDAASQREITLRRKLEENKNKKAKTVSAEEFALNHCQFEVADYEPTMGWESAKVTDRQAEYLKRAKIDLSTVKGFGHASQLLDIYFREVKKPKLASPRAVALMERMQHICNDIGIHDLNNVTAAQAGRFFAELKKRRREPSML